MEFLIALLLGISPYLPWGANPPHNDFPERHRK